MGGAPESSPGRGGALLGFRRAMKPQGPKKKISASSLREAFRKIIWPRRRLVLLGLVLIAVNRSSGMVLPASTRYLIDDVLSGSRALGGRAALDTQIETCRSAAL